MRRASVIVERLRPVFRRNIFVYQKPMHLYSRVIYQFFMNFMSYLSVLHEFHELFIYYLFIIYLLFIYYLSIIHVFLRGSGTSANLSSQCQKEVLVMIHLENVVNW